METINPNSAMLSNFEVLSLLQELNAEQKKRRVARFSPLATIIYEATRYLEDTPCKHQSADQVRNFLTALKEFKLTKAEKLMLLNNPPTTALEVQVMVEESEERFSEDEVERLLQIVQETLTTPSKDEDEASDS
ncbi:DNA-directed RNA polymerase III subunit RPC9 [Thrips palmi]|uniref:DNA-directed RNA polymerase III subunit RPC9 n=1 Tax=Thrips palmi TaxID=161013 RepID=A0A6P8Z1D4_THRPL|nr:DNA-directed RNA polymerase III subunit RPC9 [Thrips palmi]